MKYFQKNIFPPGEVRPSIIRGRCPVHHNVVVVDVGHLAALRRRRFVWANKEGHYQHFTRNSVSERGGLRKCCVAASQVEIFVITHDVDINISFILTLSIAEYDLVDARLVSPGIDNGQVHIVVPAEQRLGQKQK